MLPVRKAPCAEQLEVDQRRIGAPLGVHEQRQQDDRQQRASEQRRRCQPPRVPFVQHRHQGGQRGHDQARALPVEAAVGRQVLGQRKHQPADDRAGEADRHVDPEHPSPAQRVQQEPADRRPCAQPDRLRRRLDAERPSTPLGTGRRDDDGDAVRRQQRRSDRLQDAECDEHRQVRGKPAERRAEHEQEEAGRVQELASEHVGEAAEDRQERRHREQITDCDPADGAQSRAEFMLEPRQQQLRDAGIDLPHEGADAYGADDAPPIGREAGDELHRRRLAALEDGVAERGDRNRAGRCFIHVASSSRAGPPCLSSHNKSLTPT